MIGHGVELGPPLPLNFFFFPSPVHVPGTVPPTFPAAIEVSPEPGPGFDFGFLRRELLLGDLSPRCPATDARLIANLRVRLGSFDTVTGS